MPWKTWPEIPEKLALKKNARLISQSSNRKDYFKKLNTQIGDTLQSSSLMSIWSHHVYEAYWKNLTIQDLAFLTHPRRNYAATNDMKTAQRTPHNQKTFSNSLIVLLKISQARTPKPLKATQGNERHSSKSSKIGQIQDPVLRGCLEQCADAKQKTTQAKYCFTTNV